MERSRPTATELPHRKTGKTASGLLMNFMPLELGNLNRRRFFAGIAGAGASWLGRQALSAAEAIEAPGGTWALLSDTHIPADLG